MIAEAIEGDMLSDLSKPDRDALARMLTSCVRHLGAPSTMTAEG